MLNPPFSSDLHWLHWLMGPQKVTPAQPSGGFAQGTESAKNVSMLRKWLIDGEIW